MWEARDGAGRADWSQRASEGYQDQDENSHSHTSLSSPCGGQSQSRLSLPLPTCSPRSVAQTNFQPDHPQIHDFINAPCPQQLQPSDLFLEPPPPFSVDTNLFGLPDSQLLPDRYTFELGSQILPEDPASAATTSNINPVSATGQPPPTAGSFFPTAVPQTFQQPLLSQDETLGRSSQGRGLGIAPAIDPTPTDSSSLRSWPQPPLLSRSTVVDWPVPLALRSDKPQAPPPMPRNAASADRRQDKAGPTTDTASAAPTKSSRGPPKATRKRARVEDADEADAAEAGGQSPDPARDAEQSGQRKKTRGRPRKRRRQQIREAQRAYRARKDSAITDLEDKLFKAHEKMNNMASEFSKFIEFANTKGALSNNNVEVSRRLQDISSKFQTIASESASAGVGAGHPQAADPSGSSVVSNGTDGNGHRRILPLLGPSDSAHSSSPSFVEVTQALQVDSSYEILAHPTLSNASFPDYDPNAQMPDDLELDEEVPVATASCYVEAIGPGLPAPVSYAHQELTFGRRLQRNILERGLRLVSMESPPPARYYGVFGFCLLFESRESIAWRLTDRLMAARGESLNYWRAPFTNLGGAGWHYPNGPRHSDSSSQSSSEAPYGNQGTFEAHRPPFNTGYSMGPFWDSVIETGNFRLGRRMQVLFPGFTGEYLDPGEMEIYMRDRGISIPANADYVRVQVDLDDFNGSVDIFAHNKPRDTGPRLISGPNMGPTLFRHGSAPGAPDTNSIFPFICPAIPTQRQPPPPPPPPPPPSRKMTVDIDVTVLEEAICGFAVCLGRTPAVRPEDLDKALDRAMFNRTPIYNPLMPFPQMR